MFKKTIILLAFSTQVFAATGGSQASVASTDLSSQNLSEIVGGSTQIIQGSSQLSITAIKTIGDATYLTLKATGLSATMTLRITSSVAGHVLLSTGSVLQIISTGTGKLLCASGRIVAFLPNEMGKSLIYSAAI